VVTSNGQYEDKLCDVKMENSKVNYISIYEEFKLKQIRSEKRPDKIPTLSPIEYENSSSHSAEINVS